LGGNALVYSRIIGSYRMKEFFLNTTRLGFSVWSEKDLPYALEF